MLQKLLSLGSAAEDQSKDTMTILNFNLLPGGISREPGRRDDSTNERFSDIVLESVKLFLGASQIRKSEALGMPTAGGDGTGQHELAETQRLLSFVGEACKSKKIMMGGIFPQLIAQKA